MKIGLARLNPVAANFHLMVHAAEEFEIALRQPANKIAGLIESRPRLVAERMPGKFLRGERGMVPIAARETLTADVELAGNTDGNRP